MTGAIRLLDGASTTLKIILSVISLCTMLITVSMFIYDNRVVSTANANEVDELKAERKIDHQKLNDIERTQALIKKDIMTIRDDISEVKDGLKSQSDDVEDIKTILLKKQTQDNYNQNQLERLIMEIQESNQAR